MKTQSDLSAGSTARILTVLLFICLCFSPILAQVDYFTIDVDSLFGLWYSESDWGDYDNDNDLDLMMVGYGLGGANGEGFHRFYRNDGNSIFHLQNTGMIGAGNGCARFADLDGDNDLDAIISGQVLFSVDDIKIYENIEGIFIETAAELPHRVSTSMSFGDYDCDGDLDILMTGGTIAESTLGYLQILRNEGNFSFTVINVATTGVRNGWAEFGDYNNDGWLDIGMAGSAGSSNYITKIYKGSSTGTFIELPLTLQGLRYSKVAWVDFDCDGDLDFMVSGSFSNETPSLFKLYRNDGNDTFTDAPQTAVLGARQGDLAWGDVNNDGFADIILNGLITTTTTVANVYLFDPGTGFYVDSQQMIYLKYACMSLGDYNNDSRLDMSLSGHYEYQNYWNDLYYNSYTVNNTPPAAPTGLTVQQDAGSVTIMWDPGIDSRTPTAGLSYNLRVGTTPGGNDIVSSMSAPSGWRKVPRPGNAGTRLFYQVLNLPPDVYYWSVQAVDNSFAGSPFATEQVLYYQVENDDPQITPILRVSNSPNPFSRSTVLNLETRQPAHVKVTIYNLKGQLVRVLNDAALPAGTHQLSWDAKDDFARPVSSGIYTARIVSGSETITHKLMLVK